MPGQDDAERLALREDITRLLALALESDPAHAEALGTERADHEPAAVGADQGEADQIKQLRLALEHRDVIGQAQGVLVVSLGISAAAAFKLLVTQSQAENRELAEIASELVERAERRERRNTDPAATSTDIAQTGAADETRTARVASEPEGVTSRAELLARALVELADTLVDDFDIVDLLTTLSDRCVEVLDIEAAGIMLADVHGTLRVVTSSSEVMRAVELFELQSQEGPCLDAFRTGHAAVDHDLATDTTRWPRFATVAMAAGFRAADAIPLRLRQQTIGALNLFRTEPGSLNPDDVVAAQALADIATIAILQHRSALGAHVLNEQLNRALNSRIIIEQAKGMISDRAGLDMGHAFTRLRNHARNHNIRLAQLAEDLVRGNIDISTLG